MQPINRPPGPPYDPRSISSLPGGVSPQIRPPQDFRPPQMQPGAPSSSPFNRLPSGPPIQKMANMSLGPQMPPAQGVPSPGQINAGSSNGVPMTTGEGLAHNLPAFSDSNVPSSREIPRPDYIPGGQSDFVNSPRMRAYEQQPQSHSPEMTNDISNPPPNNFSVNRGPPPMSTMAAQPPLQGMPPQGSSAPSQPAAFMNLQSSSSPLQPSTSGMPFKPTAPTMPPQMSTPGMQIQPGSRPEMPQPPMSSMIQPRQPTIAQPQATGMGQSFVPGMPQPHGPGMAPSAVPSMTLSSVPGMPPSSVPGMPPSSVPGMPPSSVPAMSPSSTPSMPPSVLGMPSSSIPAMSPSLAPGMPLSSAPGMPPSSAPGMSPSSAPGMPPSSVPVMPPSSALGMPPSSSPSMPPSSTPGMPQSHGGPFGQNQNYMPDPRMSHQPGMSLQSPLSSHPPGAIMSPHPYGAGVPPQPSGHGAGRSFPSPGIANQARSPLIPPMPPGATAGTPGGFGMPPVGNKSTPGGMGPTQGYLPPGGPNAYPGQPGAPPTSGISPRMAQMPRMPPQPDTMHSPAMPHAGAVLPPNAGQQQQQYAPQQGGMQNRYPGATPQAPVMGGYPQNKGRQLNPDDMPSPQPVIEEDMQNRCGEFITNLKGALPPLVTTDFHVTDGGNVSPRFVRSTMYSIPGTPDLMKQTAVPFGLVISPMASLHPSEAPLYVGTSLANGPVRCNRCKAYMSPLMMFMDGGRRFQCLLCKQTNEVPSDYYCHMDSQGARADKFQRPELCLGAFEYIATPEYCRDKILPKEPAFIFVLEMTQMMLQRGIISLICQNMKQILKNLPVDEVPGQEPTRSKVHVGFITYDSSVHFYKLSGLSPEMCVVCEKESMFVPVPDGILCEPEVVENSIDKLMESIPQNFQTARETSGDMYAAINAGMAALKASGRAGKLFVFHSSLPHGEGIGKVKNRDDRKVLGTEKEKSVLTQQTSHYSSLAQDLVTAGCGVDLYLFNEAYIDIATLGQVCRLTGGQCHKYTYFTLNKDGPRLLDDLIINVGRNIAFEAVMRVRSSTGVRPVEFYGHFYMSNTHDVELAVVDSSKGLAVEIKHDDKINEEDGVYLQTALLYTSCGGQRRLRILSLSLNVCTQLADLFKSCDNDTLMNFLAKESMFKFLQTSAKQVKDNLISKTAQILSCYRKNCASPSSVGQLILPELLKLLPLYINCLSKSDALSGGQDLTCDDRSWHINQLTTMNVASSAAYLYPRLIPLSGVDPQETSIPPPLRTSYDKLSPDGVFLLENGLFIFIWVGSGTSTTWMNDVFGVAAPHHLDPVISELPVIDNEISKRVRGIIDAIRQERGSHLRLFVVPQQGKHELILRNYLVEDKGMTGSPSYVEFLCHIHKEVRAILS